MNVKELSFYILELYLFIVYSLCSNKKNYLEIILEYDIIANEHKGFIMKGSLYFLMLSLLITGCAKHQTPITKRDQLMLLSKADEFKIGERDYKQILSCSTLCTNKEQVAAINRVGKKITSVIKNGNIKHWEFILVEKDSINASCLTNGKIFINSGVFKVAKNDAQLATILAHEIAHAISRHGAARISRNKVLTGGQIAGSVATAIINPILIIPFIALYEAGSYKMVKAPFNKLEEKEADEIGLHLMKRAGYNLSESLLFWKNMKKINVKKGKRASSTHASYDKRIKDLSKIIFKLEKEKI